MATSARHRCASTSGDVPGAVDAQLRRATVYEKRLKEHPDRQHFVTEYMFVASSAADASLDYLEQGRVSADFRRSAARRIETVLNSVAQTRADWPAAKPTVQLPACRTTCPGPSSSEPSREPASS